MKYLIFDLETTGLDYRLDEIIEIGYILLEKKDDKIIKIKEENILIKQSKPLPDVIVKLTNITDEILEKDGISKLDAYKKIISVYEDDMLLIAYNLQFDIKFFNEFIKSFNNDFTIKNPILDVMAVYKDFYPYPHKLKDAILNLNIEGINSHRALDDANATYNLLHHLNSRISSEFNLNFNLKRYVNVLGQNPKYPVRESERLPYVIYINQKGAGKEIFNLKK